MRVVIGLTGASGVIYGLRTIQVLSKVKEVNELNVILSRNFIKVSEIECLGKDELIKFIRRFTSNIYFDDDLQSPLASSSYIIDAVVITPCSLKTLSDIANSRPDTLISRSAVNALRLRRKVVLVLRETPLSTIDLLNALKASIAGAVILPASPAFYHDPKSIQDLIDFIVGKILDVLGISHELYKRWTGLRDRGVTRGSSLCAQLFSL